MIYKPINSRQILPSITTDSTTTGSDATIQNTYVPNGIVRLTNVSLVSISGIPAATAGQSVIIENQTSNPVVINNNDAGASVGNRIYTGTGVNATILANSTFEFIYDGVLGYWMLIGGTGTGSGGFINYITNPDAEAGLLDWNLYQNTAANIPSTGTGGSPTGLTFTRSTVNPLIGLGSFVLTQANSTNVQGEGVSTDFTIDNAYQANILAVSFNYNASSTFVPGDGITPPLNDGTTSINLGNSDVEVFIYDVTNAVLLPVLPEIIQANGSNNFSFAGVFQTSFNSTSYRLILHCATANANATGWTFKFDNVFVGPQILGIGSSGLNSTQTTLTSGSGTYTPPSGVTRLKIRMIGGGGGGGGGNLTPGSAAGGTGGITTLGPLTANGGNGGSTDEPGGTGGAAAAIPVGIIGISLAGGGGGGGGNYNGGPSGASTPFGGGGPGAGQSGSAPGNASPNTGGGGGGSGAQAGVAFTGSGGGAGNYVEALINTPGVSYAYTVGAGGAAGSSTFSGGAGGSGIIIIDEYYSNSESAAGITSALPTIVEAVDFNLYSLATTINIWQLVTSGWNIVIPTTGYWKLSYKTAVVVQASTGEPDAGIALSTSTTPGVGLIEGNSVSTTTGAGVQSIFGTYLQTKPLYLTAGTTIYLQAKVEQYLTSSSVTSFEVVNNAPTCVVNGGTGGYIRAELVPNFASQDSATTSVNASYGCSTNTTINVGDTLIPYDTLDYDTHNAFNISTSLYTVPVSGKYEALAHSAVHVNLAAGDGCFIEVYKNGVEYRELGGTIGIGAGIVDYRIGGVTGIPCVAGDTLAFFARSAVTGALIGGTMVNYFSINRIGN